MEPFKRDVAQSVFSEADWERCYAVKDYPQSQRARAYPLQYAIVHEGSSQTVIELIRQLKKRALTAVDSLTYLAPLHVAVMRGRVDIFERILMSIPVRERSRAINEEDGAKWTVLHHAAVSSEEIYRRILSFPGHNFEKETLLRGTHEHLYQLTHPTTVPRRTDVKVEKEPGSRPIPLSSLNSGEINKLFNIESWLEDPFYAANELHFLREEVEETPFQSCMGNSLRSSVNGRYAALVIKKNRELEQAGEGAWSVVAAQNIACGSIICEYTGKRASITFNEPLVAYQNAAERVSPESDYYVKPYQARLEGNVGRFINYGPPNSALITLVAKGCERLVSVALREIACGEQILYDAGIASTNWAFGRHLLFDKKRLEIDYRAGLRGIIEGQQNHKIITNFRSPILFSQSLLTFPLSSPIAMLYLHFANIIPVKDWIAELAQVTDKESPFHSWWKNCGHETFLTKCILWNLHKLTNALEGIPEKDQFYAWAKDNVERYPSISFLKGLVILMEVLEKETPPPQPLITIMETFLRDYNPSTDEDYIFSIRRLAVDNRAIHSFWGVTEEVQCSDFSELQSRAYFALEKDPHNRRLIWLVRLTEEMMGLVKVLTR